MSGPTRISASDTTAVESAATNFAHHAETAERTLERLAGRSAGLDEGEAAARLERFGPNRLKAPKPPSALHILADQLRSVVVLLLLAASFVALVVGDLVEAAAIGLVLLINTALGFVTELRARRAMAALLRFDAPRAKVLRDGQEREIDAALLVPGDVIRLEPGAAIAADARLLTSHELQTSEAALTGESLPVAKDAAADVAADAPLAERPTVVLKGTSVVAGTGHAVVTGTGMNTELGRIGGLIASVKETDTPLERRLDALGRRLILATAALTALIVGVGWLRGEPLNRMLQTGIALAIAAVPEGLPAVATIALAVGLRRMARRNALVRRLPAVESLGSTTVVCTDKTGTLTAGQMMVTAIALEDGEVSVSGSGYVPEGEFRRDGGLLDPTSHAPLASLLEAAAMMSRADIRQEDEGGWIAVGDPTEAALVAFARKAGYDRAALLEAAPEVGEVPFSSGRQFMATFHRQAGEEVLALMKGAPHRVLEACSDELTAEGERPLDEAARSRLEARNEELAGRGLRVLALARGTVAAPAEDALRDLTFLGLVGMIDPPADGVLETIQRFRTAGIRTVMITGDQRLTAEAISRELGVLTDDEETLDGRDLHHLDDAALLERVDRVGTYSRVSPEDKLRIVSALRERGEIVAMLGDGANDAAALRRADVGVAMGMRGTDVARETAAVVLQDDRFPTIGAAIEEGRVIYDNIRKFIFYLFSCNLAEVLVLFVASVVGWPLPLLPLQILWLNLVTDTFPALSLALEPAEPRVMERPPRDPQAAILSRRFVSSIAMYAALITGVTLIAFRWPTLPAHDVEGPLTMTFTTLAFAQLFHLGNARSPEPVLHPARAFANRYSLGAVVLVVALQMLAIYWTPLARVLRVRALTAAELALCAALASVPAFTGQLLRMARRRRRRLD